MEVYALSMSIFDYKRAVQDPKERANFMKYNY